MTQIHGTKYRWLVAPAAAADYHAIACGTSLPIAIAHALAARGFTTARQVQEFIWLSEQSPEADSMLLRDAHKAVDRLCLAISRGEKILIAGDYDVDGMTSTAVLMTCLRAVGANVNFFLPHRLKDGYGLSVKTVQKAHDNNFGLIITVDNGITAFAAAQKAQELGIDLIITDHHRPREDEAPPAFAIVNPHQKGCAYPFKDFAGVGVAFKCMQMLCQKLGVAVPDAVYELLALGTIADVVPLRGENRYWVQYGLARMQQKPTPALCYMIQETPLSDKKALDARDIGFTIAPQLNALGRLDDPRAAVGFLLGLAPERMVDIAQRLKELNAERKKVEKAIVQEIDETLQARGYNPYTEPIIVVYADHWQAGVIGLAAGKLMHQYGVPALVLCGSPTSGIYKGSARAPAWCNIVQLLEQAKDLLVQFGGHPAAAGLSVSADNLARFTERMIALARVQAEGQLIGPLLRLDAPLLVSDVTPQFGASLDMLQPFGAGNQEPVFYIARATIIQPPQRIKDQHIKVLISDDGVSKPVIFFFRPELYEWFGARVGQFCQLAVQVTKNHWNGTIRYELLGLDVASHIEK